LPLLAPACSRVEQTYLIEPPEAFVKPNGVNLDHLEAFSRVHELRGARVLIEFSDPLESLDGRGKSSPKRDFNAFVGDYARALSDQLWRTGLFADVGLPDDPRPIRDPTHVLRFAITEWDEGSAWLQFLIGNWAGSTRVQTEGEFIDASDGARLAAFADARVHPGHGPFGLSTWRPQTLISLDLAQQIRDLQRGLFAILGEPWPRKGLPRLAPVRPFRPQSPDPPPG
jgi:hypothetical protein